jgi:hypothetical protein
MRHDAPMTAAIHNFVGMQPPALGSSLLMRMPSGSSNASNQQTANTKHLCYQEATLWQDRPCDVAMSAGTSLSAHLIPGSKVALRLAPTVASLQDDASNRHCTCKIIHISVVELIISMKQPSGTRVSKSKQLECAAGSPQGHACKQWVACSPKHSEQLQNPNLNYKVTSSARVPDGAM